MKNYYYLDEEPSKRSYKTAVISFIDDNSIIVEGERLKYSDIENSWIGGGERFCLTSGLWLKIKNRIFLRFVCFERNFDRMISESDETEILEEFKKRNLLHEGPSGDKYFKKAFIGLSVFIIFLLILDLVYIMVNK